MSMSMRVKNGVRGALVAALLGSGLIVVACEQGGEGNRCNPDLSHDECGSGLTCQQPLPCVENYCCPVDRSTSTNPYCQGAPSVCPSDDAGATADDAGSDTGPVIDAGGGAALDASGG